MRSRSTPGPPSPAGDDSDAGFTILEALVALVVLGLAIAMTLQAFSLGLDGQARLRRHLEAAALAEARLSELSLLPADSLMRYAVTRRGTFAAPFEGYRWRALTRTSPAAPRLVEAAVLVEWRTGTFALETTFYTPERVAPVVGGRR